MKTLERFDLTQCGTLPANGEMTADIDGDWVRFDDHAAMEQASRLLLEALNKGLLMQDRGTVFNRATELRRMLN